MGFVEYYYNIIELSACESPHKTLTSSNKYIRLQQRAPHLHQPHVVNNIWHETNFAYFPFFVFANHLFLPVSCCLCILAHVLGLVQALKGNRSMIDSKRLQMHGSSEKAEAALISFSSVFRCRDWSGVITALCSKQAGKQMIPIYFESVFRHASRVIALNISLQLI